jgi:hypothetical protein
MRPWTPGPFAGAFFYLQLSRGGKRREAVSRDHSNSSRAYGEEVAYSLRLQCAPVSRSLHDSLAEVHKRALEGEDVKPSDGVLRPPPRLGKRFRTSCGTNTTGHCSPLAWCTVKRCGSRCGSDFVGERRAAKSLILLGRSGRI